MRIFLDSRVLGLHRKLNAVCVCVFVCVKESGHIEKKFRYSILLEKKRKILSAGGSCTLER